MSPTEKILYLIDKGESLLILEEESLTGAINELLKYRFIDLEDGKVILTKKGKDARTTGFERALYESKMEEELRIFSPQVQKKEFTLFKLSLFVCLFLLLWTLILSLSKGFFNVQAW